MKPQLKVITGFHAGTTHVFSKPSLAIGRHPKSDLKFDPEQELDVSGRHAEIVLEGKRWLLSDVGSRNGTFVNGHPISNATALENTDQIRLGTHGPLLEFRLVHDDVPDTILGQPAPPAHQQPQPETKKRETSERVRREVVRQTRHLRRLSAILVILLFAVGGGLWLVNRVERKAQERKLTDLQTRIDNVLAESNSTATALENQMEDLATTLDGSRRQVLALQSGLRQAQAAQNEERIASLSRELETALSALTQQQYAAQMDFQRVVEDNQQAVAMLFVDFGSGEMETGTAFAVRADGTLLTSRHVVAGPAGDRRALRIAVRFADSRQTFPARVIGLPDDPEIDLALLRVELRGDTPTVASLNARPDSVHVGAPVAVIGFPGGMTSPQAAMEDGVYAATTLTAGTVSKNLPNLLQINGYGSPGASGSPIFDANGEVIGVLSGGEVGSGGRIVYAVPADRALRLLASNE